MGMGFRTPMGEPASVKSASSSFGTRAKAEMSPKQLPVLFLWIPFFFPPVRTEGRPFTEACRAQEKKHLK